MLRQDRFLRTALLAAVFVEGVSAGEILETKGFSSCAANASVTVQKLDITYNNDNKTVNFDVQGTSTKVQNVTAILNVTAYGQQVYSNSFNPCAESTFVQQLCPVPEGTFGAQGSQVIPVQYSNMVPSIAFEIPDIDAQATLQLKSADGQDVACIQSDVSNGKTASIPAVSYVAAAVAGAALIMGGATAVGAAVAGGSAAAGGSLGGLGTISPSFTEVFGWFQGMAMNGMHSVNYPSVYRSFSKNFGFSTGLVPWNQMQTAIDNFRAATGGNLTDDNVQFLRNATLVFPDGSTETPNSSMAKVKRAFDHFEYLATRGFTTSVNSTSANDTSSDSTTQSIPVAVRGIQGYVEELSIPSANTFMTVLLVVAVVIAAIAVGILLVKVILEIWSLFGSFPKTLTGFRKHYWGSIARAITSLILLLYGVWVLYCIFQFTHGDSWAAKVLAGVTLALFTGILAFFTWKIWNTARKLKQTEGDAAALYDDKSIWVKYSLFYESYRKDYWWLFVPTIVYMFAKGCVLAGADGNGMVQTIAQLVIESVMLILLLWSRPYERKSSNIINIIIQVVRFLSVVCILVFVEEFGIAQTTQTIAGVVLIAVQSALSGILAILIGVNTIFACCKENPHRKRRKELEKLRDMDTLTPLDAHNSLLLDRKPEFFASSTFAVSNTLPTIQEEESRALSIARPAWKGMYLEPANPYAGSTLSKMESNLSNGGAYRPLTPNTPLEQSSRGNLVSNAAPMGNIDTRQPTLPIIEPHSSSNYSRPAFRGSGPFSHASAYGIPSNPYTSVYRG